MSTSDKMEYVIPETGNTEVTTMSPDKATDNVTDKVPDKATDTER